MAIATARASRSIRRPAICGSIEHGPQGGDELNILGKGKNYGWPVIGYGINYDGAKIHESTRRPAWSSRCNRTPVIAPSGLTFYTGTLFPKWKGSLFTGALQGKLLVRFAQRTMPSPARSVCCRTSTSASATSGKGRTARYGF